MSSIFEVRAQSGERVHAFGARRTRQEAEALLGESRQRVAAVGGRNDRYWIDEIDTSGMFEIPSRPTPRERFHTRITLLPKLPQRWQTVRVEVLEGERTVGAYDRNYSMLQTFEPFRQGDRHLALVAPGYTATSIMDLSTGEIIGGEEPGSDGFCPAGFYVPDWWDVHDGSVLPGSMHWSPDREWPLGDFGFVWGCIWGDDSSWKIQFLDLSDAGRGVVRRDERFGYLELDSHPNRPASEFIRVSRHGGRMGTTFSVLQRFDIKTGERREPFDQ